MSIASKSVSVPMTTTGFLLSVLRSAPSICQCVLDGGHLLHVAHWPTAARYKQVCDAYVTYIVQHYGGQSDSVFDGYCRSVSTKAAEQQGRATQSISADILFECYMKTTTTQKSFLANSKKKARLIDKLTTELQRLVCYLTSLAPRKTSPSSPRGQQHVFGCGNTLCEGREKRLQWNGNNLCPTDCGW